MSKKHVRSRFGLTRCPSCRAHVRAADTPSETSCPFCGAALTSAPRRIVRAGRGGVLAASLLALSCSGGSSGAEPAEPPAIEDDPSGGDDTTSENQNTADDQGTADEQGTADDQGTPEDERYGEADEPVPVDAYGIAPSEPFPQPPPVPAYGIAPSRRTP